jgi:RNA polymerase sigma-70 factor (ECF subfamily)
MHPSESSPASSDSAWRICYDEIAPKLLLFARQWVPSQADAEDAVQTAFVRFWRHRPDASAAHYPLLFAAVKSAALDLIRSRSRRARRESESTANAVWFDAPLEEQDDADALQEALAQLPAEQREVVVLRIWAGMTFSQIAETLDESINTIASRYRYAVAALRRTIPAPSYERY